MKRVTRMAKVVFGAIVLSSSMAVADTCKTVSGQISALQPVPCTNLLGCFTGTFSGDLTGTFQSRLTTLTVVDGTQGAGIVQFNARTVLETTGNPGGVLFTIDAGTGTNCQFFDNGQFICFSSNETLTITSGLRGYAQAYGSIVLGGPYLAGMPGSYQGQICIGNGNNK